MPPYPPARAPASLSQLDPATLLALRADMLRFARLQLRHAEVAEDLVQEAIEAALRGAPGFAGQSSLKTWVFAILRHRIIDHLRTAARVVPMSSLVDDGDDWQEQVEALFNAEGRWREDARPVPWPAPDASMQSKQFWRVFEACLDHLPAQMGRVFMMREFLGLETAEICEQAGVSDSNCHVLLHRARLKLRDCLQRGWGDPEGAPC